MSYALGVDRPSSPQRVAALRDETHARRPMVENLASPIDIATLTHSVQTQRSASSISIEGLFPSPLGRQRLICRAFRLVLVKLLTPQRHRGKRFTAGVFSDDVELRLSASSSGAGFHDRAESPV
jgi:hypothetical protein